MASYLANYGAGEEQREKKIRRLVTLGVVVALIGSLYLVAFQTPILERYLRVVQRLKNHRQEREVRTFLELLRKPDYKAAYELWGCTDARPCRDYPFTNFMDDWGPRSTRSDVNAYHIARSRSCGSGVILTVDAAKGQEEKLWVERDDLTIAFSPWPGCPPGR
jgi:hypothetical protein